VAAIHLVIHGRVQGVGYRAWTVRNAQKLGLTGWARNRTDGTVEAVFCGGDDAVEAMLAACGGGPLAAKVTAIDRAEWTGETPADFRQLATV
jgi:acylphosphatase